MLDDAVPDRSGSGVLHTEAHNEVAAHVFEERFRRFEKNLVTRLKRHNRTMAFMVPTECAATFGFQKPAVQQYCTCACMLCAAAARPADGDIVLAPAPRSRRDCQGGHTSAVWAMLMLCAAFATACTSAMSCTLHNAGTEASVQ